MMATAHAVNKPLPRSESKLAHRAACWIRSLANSAADPRREIVDSTGLADTYVREILAGKASGDLRLSTLERIAERLGWTPIAVLISIESADSAETIVQGIASREIAETDRAWREVIAPDLNLATAYRIGVAGMLQLDYQDLMLDVLVAIVTRGPRDAIPRVVEILSQHPRHESAVERNTRAALEAQLRAATHALD